MAQPFIPLKISNYQALGKLIKTWATGVSRFTPAGSYLPRPATIDAFCKMLVKSKAAKAADVTAWRKSFGGTLGDIEFVQTTRHKLYIRLPMIEMLLYREEQIGEGYAYSLPAFYSADFFAGAKEVIKDPMKGHDERVGDYSIAQCG